MTRCSVCDAETQKDARGRLRKTCNAECARVARSTGGTDGMPLVGREHGVTLSECAALFGVTVQRIQQIEKAALQKLRKALDQQGLTFQDFLERTQR